MKETQEMLDYCAENGIVSDIEHTPIQKINEAFDRVVKADVKYRFVIDMNSLEITPRSNSSAITEPDCALAAHLCRPSARLAPSRASRYPHLHHAHASCSRFSLPRLALFHPRARHRPLAPTGSAQSPPRLPQPAAHPAAQSAPAAAAKPSFAYDAANLAALVPTPRPEDVRSPENIISACYAVISGPPGPRDWDRFRSLFIPQARLTASHQRKDGSTAVTLLGVADYVHSPAAASSRPDSSRTPSTTTPTATEISPRSSPATNPATPSPTLPPSPAASTAFSWSTTDPRWWVVSILWDEETPSNPIPPEFDKH